jgi:hypothetical protein
MSACQENAGPAYDGAGAGNAHGVRMDRHAASRRLRQLADAAGIRMPRMYPHLLRCAFVTTMLDAGVSLRDVQIYRDGTGSGEPGAAVSVVTQAPEDGVREELLLATGCRRTCDFYEGALKAVHQKS